MSQEIANCPPGPLNGVRVNGQRAEETGGGSGGYSADWSRVLDTSYADNDVSFSDLEI